MLKSSRKYWNIFFFSVVVVVDWINIPLILENGNHRRHRRRKQKCWRREVNNIQPIDEFFQLVRAPKPYGFYLFFPFVFKRCLFIVYYCIIDITGLSFSFDFFYWKWPHTRAVYAMSTHNPMAFFDNVLLSIDFGFRALQDGCRW